MFRGSPNIVRMVGFSYSPFVILMKNYSMGSLHNTLHKSGRKVAYTKLQKLNLLLDIANALNVIHAAGIVHCDIKPANILIELSGPTTYKAVVTDFGISRVFSKKTLLVKEFTPVRHKGASPPYASPELITILLKIRQTEKIRPACDVYSLACVMFEVTGGTKCWWSRSSKRP